MTRKADDRLALMATLIGAGLALAGWRSPIELVSGLAIGLGGVLLAVRGDRAVDGRAWMRAAMVTGALAFIASLGLALYVDWLAGQWLAGGARSGSVENAELVRWVRVGMGARYLGLFCALAFVLGAVVNRFSGNKKGPDYL
ncbi:MAG TPA: hypothetical protein VFF06_24990 [Polyangia bacterium]|nr:hypothetical protein [Polyangia bacterium]